jgi:hypothetical protein
MNTKILGITLIVVTATFVLASFQDSGVQGSKENAAAAPQEEAEESAEESTEAAMTTGAVNQTSNMTSGTTVIEED